MIDVTPALRADWSAFKLVYEAYQKARLLSDRLPLPSFPANLQVSGWGTLVGFLNRRMEEKVHVEAMGLSYENLIFKDVADRQFPHDFNTDDYDAICDEDVGNHWVHVQCSSKSELKRLYNLFDPADAECWGVLWRTSEQVHVAIPAKYREYTLNDVKHSFDETEEAALFLWCALVLDDGFKANIVDVTNAEHLAMRKVDPRSLYLPSCEPGIWKKSSDLSVDDYFQWKAVLMSIHQSTGVEFFQFHEALREQGREDVIKSEVVWNPND